MQPVQQTTGAPAEIQQLARTFQLGAIQQVYGPNTSLARARRVGGVGMLVMGLLLCLLGIASIAGGASGGIAIVLGLLVAGGSLFFFLRAAQIEQRRVRLYVCEGGLIHQDGSSAAQPFRWDQVATVWRKLTVIRNYASRRFNPRPFVKISYTIERRDGHTFQLDNTIGGFDALVPLIVTKTRELLLPPLLRDYAQGRTLAFGPLALNQQGIIKGQELLPWPQVEAIEYLADYNKEVVRVKQQGAWLDWAKISTSALPNLNVFLSLANSVRQRAVPASQVPPGEPTPITNAFAGNPAQPPGSQTAQSVQGSTLEILQQRFARGEIDEATYQSMREQLRS
jgi:Short C-terminal domain